MFISLFAPITDLRARTSWVRAGAGAAAFAVGLLAYPLSPLVAAPLLLGMVPAILLPALQTGWRGAWGGFVLALLAGEVGLSTIVLTGETIELSTTVLVLTLGVALIVTVVSGVVGTLIVRRRSLIAAVDRAEHRLVDFIDALPTACLVLDLGGRVILSNQTARALLRTDAPEEYNLFLRDLVGMEAWPAVCDRLLDRSPGAPLRVTIPNEVPLQTEWVFGAHDDGKARRTLAFFWDITEKVRREEETKALLAADKQATLGRLVAGAAHEINDPLMVILGHAELLKEVPGLPGEAASFVEVILREGARAGQVTRELLDFAGHRPAGRATVDLGTVVRGAVAFRESYARAAGIELTVHTPASPHVAVDVDQVQQVVLNLLMDAEDAVRDAKEKRIGVTVGQRGDQALLIVNDSGPALPEEREVGFGLASTAGIVAEHGGAMTASRGVLGGTQFTVRFPTVLPIDRAAVKAAVSAEVGEATHLNVLVVDDEPAILRSVGRCLERLGHSVRTASSGAEAIEIVRDEVVDVVISDLRMPEMSGRELHARLRAMGALHTIDFIVASGDVGDPEAVAFLESTGLPVLVKPFRIKDLTDVLGRTRPMSVQVERVLERAG